MRRLSLVFVLFAFVASTVGLQARVLNAPPKISIAVDATEAPRKIFHAKLTIQASPGPLSLVYPKWIPGEHAPTGPIADLAGVKFFANGKNVPWTRDLVDMNTLHCNLPAGANSLEVHLDYLSPALAQGFSAGASATAKLALVSWNQLLLYPSGWRSADLTVTPSISLPSGWKYGTSLTTTGESGNAVSFAPVSVVTLIDSPVLTGEYFRKVPLAESDPPTTLDIAADSAAALEIAPEHTAHLKNLVSEASTLYGSHHYRHYDFLLTLSDHTAHFGLEHHESSDDRIAERSLVDHDLRLLSAGLLPHEYTHSWNGKYRRPAGLATPDYQKPMIDDMLWVYEGLTEYLGQVLTARSGLLTPEIYREELARTAAILDRATPGRAWRSLEDTAVDAQDLYGTRGDAWASWRRSTDFYDESELIWLEADVIIRQSTQNTKSLDDFCKLFLGGQSGAPAVVPYTFDQVVALLNQVVPYDWRDFFFTRLQGHGPGAPLGGIGGSGWKLVYHDTKPEIVRAGEEARDYSDFLFSLGFTVNKEDALPDVIVGSPAYEAGIGPGMVLVAVNGRKYTKHRLIEALREGKGGSQPLELLLQNGDFYNTYKINYHDGERYAALERDSTKSDLLSQIVAPHAK